MIDSNIVRRIISIWLYHAEYFLDTRQILNGVAVATIRKFNSVARKSGKR